MHWLMKAEPHTRIVRGVDVAFSVDHFEKARVSPWDGVRNYQARNFMRDEMKEGNCVLFYHSNTKLPGVAALAKVCRNGYPDESAWTHGHPYFDAQTDRARPRWFCVDVQFVRRLRHFVPLAVLQYLADPALPEAHRADVRYLSDAQLHSLREMALLHRSRLSVQPVEPLAYEAVCLLGEHGGFDAWPGNSTWRTHSPEPARDAAGVKRMPLEHIGRPSSFSGPPSRHASGAPLSDLDPGNASGVSIGRAASDVQPQSSSRARLRARHERSATSDGLDEDDERVLSKLTGVSRSVSWGRAPAHPLQLGATTPQRTGALRPADRLARNPSFPRRTHHHALSLSMSPSLTDQETYEDADDGPNSQTSSPASSAALSLRSLSSLGNSGGRSAGARASKGGGAAMHAAADDVRSSPGDTAPGFSAPSLQQKRGDVWLPRAAAGTELPREAAGMRLAPERGPTDGAPPLPLPPPPEDPLLPSLSVSMSDASSSDSSGPSHQYRALHPGPAHYVPAQRLARALPLRPGELPETDATSPGRRGAGDAVAARGAGGGDMGSVHAWPSLGQAAAPMLTQPSRPPDVGTHGADPYAHWGPENTMGGRRGQRPRALSPPIGVDVSRASLGQRSLPNVPSHGTPVLETYEGVVTGSVRKHAGSFHRRAQVSNPDLTQSVASPRKADASRSTAGSPTQGGNVGARMSRARLTRFFSRMFQDQRSQPASDPASPTSFSPTSVGGLEGIAQLSPVHSIFQTPGVEGRRNSTESLGPARGAHVPVGMLATPSPFRMSASTQVLPRPPRSPLMTPITTQDDDPSDDEASAIHGLPTRPVTPVRSLSPGAPAALSVPHAPLAPLGAAAPAGAPCAAPEYPTRARTIDEYEILEDMGGGAYGFVRRARASGGEGGEDVIIKYIIKSCIFADSWRRHRLYGTIPAEIFVLLQLQHTPYTPPAQAPAYIADRTAWQRRRDAVVAASGGQVMGHPGICKLEDFFEDEEYYYLVMPRFGSGQDLFDYVESSPYGLPLREVRSFLGQIADVIAFLHANGIVHRDIKDENVILDASGLIQLIDFGGAARIRTNRMFDTFSGTVDYAAAEILQGAKYAGPPQDIWAFGVTAYVLVCGECPFHNADEAAAGLSPTSRPMRILQQFCLAQGAVGPYGARPPRPEFEDDALTQVFDLICQCLQLDPDLRPSAPAVLRHAFLAGPGGWWGGAGEGGARGCVATGGKAAVAAPAC
ncbi:serine/threonine protein kinase [Malassezia sp. CBS 17886]|nr:serine/threonine protein kinase [Malassezia sp. CBS 17886]